MWLCSWYILCVILDLLSMAQHTHHFMKMEWASSVCHFSIQIIFSSTPSPYSIAALTITTKTMTTTTSYFINALSQIPLCLSIHYSWNLINFTAQFSMPKQFTDQTLFMSMCVNVQQLCYSENVAKLKPRLKRNWSMSHRHSAKRCSKKKKKTTTKYMTIIFQ